MAEDGNKKDDLGHDESSDADTCDTCDTDTEADNDKAPDTTAGINQVASAAAAAQSRADADSGNAGMKMGGHPLLTPQEFWHMSSLHYLTPF